MAWLWREVGGGGRKKKRTEEMNFERITNMNSGRITT